MPIRRQYLAGVDVGTTGTRCSIYDLKGQRVGSEYLEYPSIYPHPGWVEQDIQFMVKRCMEACRAAISSAGVAPENIASIGFSTQRSVTCPVDADGEPVRDMISWQDARTGDEVADMRRLIDDEEYYALSGLPMGTTWILSKILWMRKNEPEFFEKTAKVVQNQDIVLRAFGAEGFFTDMSCMPFYGVWDVKNGCWNDKLMSLFDLTPEFFGTPTPPGTQVGVIGADIAAKTGFAEGTPICVGAGDQNCSVVGMGAVKPGMATVTLGTAGLAILTVDSPVPGFGGMMITHHAVPNQWEVEGLSNAAASSLRWFRDVIGTREKEIAEKSGADAYALLDQLAAKSKPGSHGILYMPYLATAGTPRWNANARSAFIGMSLAHNRADMTRAVMEGVVLEIRDMIEGWREQGMEAEVLRLGGGAAKSKLWNQIQADVYGRPVQIPRESDSTVLGAAILGGVGAGIFSSIDEGVKNMVHVAGELEPDMANHHIYEEMYRAYRAAYNGLAESGTYDLLAGLQEKFAQG
ncbi:MAG: xylulose kinase [Kiritimatiellaeota bacterium]|nr:xylulose kinase [Kiritimatiellota bacterium]